MEVYGPVGFCVMAAGVLLVAWLVVEFRRIDREIKELGK